MQKKYCKLVKVLPLFLNSVEFSKGIVEINNKKIQSKGYKKQKKNKFYKTKRK